MNQIYVYCAVASVEERECCQLELQAFFDLLPIWADQYAFIVHEHQIDITRSPYIKWQLRVWHTVQSPEQA